MSAVSSARRASERDPLGPAIGASVRVYIVRAVFAIIMSVLCVLLIDGPVLITVGIGLAALALVFPESPSAWLIIALIAVPLVVAGHTVPLWHVILLVAGAQALHEFGLIGMWLPRRGRVQLRVFAGPLRSYLAVQVPSQAVAIAVFGSLNGGAMRGLSSPLYGIAAAIALVGLVTIVVVPILRDRHS